VTPATPGLELRFFLIYTKNAKAYGTLNALEIWALSFPRKALQAGGIHAMIATLEQL